MSREPMTWDELVDLCSRLHTKRQRRAYPSAPMREASQMIDVLIDGLPAQIVPTRMHEPGFYLRFEYESIHQMPPRRSDFDLKALRRAVEAGEVFRVT